MQLIGPGIRVFFLTLPLGCTSQDPGAHYLPAGRLAFAEQSSLAERINGAHFQGSATLAMGTTRVRIGSDASLRVLFHCSHDSSEGWLFNPFFGGNAHPPAILAIYDSRREFVGSYFDLKRGSCEDSREGNWALIQPDGEVGAQLTFLAGEPPGTIVGQGLPPGKYYAQMVLLGTFLGMARGGGFFNPLRDNGPFMDFDSRVVCRSNIVKFELIR